MANMMHHQQKYRELTQSNPTQSPPKPNVKHTTERRALGAYNDELPDGQMKFLKMANAGSQGLNSDSAQPMSPRCRKPSLLTQALTSPELGPLSDTEAPVLTSDGGMTSPARTNTPSPPLPTVRHMKLDSLGTKEFLDLKHEQEPVKSGQDAGHDQTQEVKVEEKLGRRRCISFACLQKNSSQADDDKSRPKATHQNRISPSAVVPQKRPCMLRFACPMKPSAARSQVRNEPEKAKALDQEKMSNQTTLESSIPISLPRGNSQLIGQASQEGSREGSAGNVSSATTSSILSTSVKNQDRTLPFNRIDFQKSEATRFHEFAGSFADEGEWANEQTAFRQKITIHDTLRKENAIRKLAEEAEEEAREEDDEVYDNGIDSLDEASDDGNESDDEDGFADSDEESDGGSAYQFWTPGFTTATTSIDHLDHFRPMSHRTISESSLESAIGKSLQDVESLQMDKKVRTGYHARKGTHSYPSDLPDSSDFVVGTIDEDQLFEEEYLSRMKQKERSKQKLIPQDIDPSFPTSDPEGEGDDDDDPDNGDGGEEEDAKAAESDSSQVLNSLQSCDENDSAGAPLSPGASRLVPNHSPRRLHSPPPSRRLFGQAFHRFHSPPPLHRKLISPPSSRRPSLSGSPNKIRGVNIARLGQRPNLTHTASLPRTPNPFWDMHSTSGSRELGSLSTGTSPKPTYIGPQESHRRGPIEIVQGLEGRRQRRKDKLWRQQCSRAHAGKDRERRCQPGKGAQRMREVGLVMADRFKGYKQDAKLVLSV